MESETIIQVKNLTVYYGDTLVLKDINFSVRKGEMFVILGERLRENHTAPCDDRVDSCAFRGSVD